MTFNDPQDPLDHLLKAGLVAVRAEDWTPEWALSVIRENRRRYAHEEWIRLPEKLAERLAKELPRATGVAPADISAVLLLVGAQLGALVALEAISGPMLTEIMQMAADDLDRQAKAGEQL